MPKEYKLTNTSKNGTATTLTNSFDWSSVKYTIPVNKQWYDKFNGVENAYGARANVVISIKAKNLTITKDSEGKESYTVTNKTPAEYTTVKDVTLTADDLKNASLWSKDVEVRKYDDNGKVIEYSVEEKSGPSDYSTTIKDKNTVENTYNNITIIENRKGDISDNTYETRLDTVIVLDISGSMDKDGKLIDGTGVWVYNKPYPISYIHREWGGNQTTIFFTDENNPPRGIDSSLIEYIDGKWHFKKDTTARTVTETWNGYNIRIDRNDHSNDTENYRYIEPKYNTRINSAVDAVNESIDAVLYKTDENGNRVRTNSRVSLVVYSSAEDESGYNDFNAATMLPLGEYNPNESGEYIHLTQNDGDSDDVISVVAKTKNNGNITNNTSSAIVAGGTYTQAGIKQGGDILVSNPDKTYESNRKTLNYIPVMILVTDGEPTYYNDEPNVSGNERHGEGNYNDQTYDEHTIETAAFYKEKVTRSYDTECQVYTIGYGLLNNQRAKDMLNPGDSSRNSVLYTNKKYQDIVFDYKENNEEPYHCAYDYATRASTTGTANTADIVAAMKDVVEHIQNYEPYKTEKVSNLGSVKTAELTNLDIKEKITIELIDSAGNKDKKAYTYSELQEKGAITGNVVDFTNSMFKDAKYITVDYRSTESIASKTTKVIKSKQKIELANMEPIIVKLTDEEIRELEESASTETTETNKQDSTEKTVENKKETEGAVAAQEENKEVETEKKVSEEKNNSSVEETETIVEKEEKEDKEEKEESKEEKKEKIENNEKTEENSTKASSNEQENSETETKTEKETKIETNIETETVKTEVTEENNN